MAAGDWRTLSVLIAGCGSIGKRHSRVLSSIGIRDIRICDPLEQQRKALIEQGPAFRQYADYEEALAAKPDAVLICTPPDLHIPMAIRALRSGAHVLCEKPLSSSLQGVDELAAVIESTGRTFMVAFCFRYHEGLVRAKAHLESGRVGRLVAIRCRMSENLPEVRPDYQGLFTLKQGGAFDLTHEVDLACWFAKGAVTEVRSIHGACSDIGFTAPDVVELVLRFENRCIAGVHLDFFSFPRTRLTELMGTKGTISVEFASWEKCVVSVFEAIAGKWEHEELATERDFMFRNEDAEFLEAACAGTAVGIPLSEARKSLEIICAAQTGRSGF